ncbi:MAG TPA: AraC family transcriptional regulator, partial [Spirochaetia bacterium]|nr:AraC family transcriptional regulator [Spirochaetia bacterium]
TSPLREFMDTSRITLDERAALYIGNVAQASWKSITRTIARLSSTLEVAIGVSECSAEVSDFPRLLRQAKSAYYAEFVTGLKQAVIYERIAAPVLTVLANDFEALFAVGDEARLRRLTEQLPGVCSTSRPTVDELLGLYNTILTGANRMLFADGRQSPVRGLLPDPDTMVRRFSSVHHLADELQELLSEVFGSAGENGRTEFAARDLVASVKQFVRNNLSSNLSADGIAAKFGVDRMALSTRFRAETGSSLPEYVRGARLDHACFLLKHTALSVQEIAQMCGYDDYFYFARLFRGAKGMTASEFRKTTGRAG